MSKWIIASATTLALAFWNSASALTGVTAHVTLVEPTYMPSEIVFSLDSGSTICPSTGSFYWLNSNVENVKAVYATLVTALTAGNRITVYLNDGDTTCTVQYIHLLTN